MDQMVHLNQLIAHVLSFIVFFFLVRGAFLSIIYPPMKERRERIIAEQERIEKEKAEAVRLRRGATKAASSGSKRRAGRSSTRR